MGREARRERLRKRVQLRQVEWEEPKKNGEERKFRGCHSKRYERVRLWRVSSRLPNVKEEDCRVHSGRGCCSDMIDHDSHLDLVRHLLLDVPGLDL